MKKTLILMALLTFLGTSGLFGQEVFEEGKDLFSTSQVELSAAVNRGQKVYVVSALNLTGSLIIKASETDRALFRYRKILKTDSRAEAIDFSRVIDAVSDRTPDGIKLLLQAPNPAPWSGTENAGVIEGELLIPPGCDLYIDAIYFDLDVTGPCRSLANKSSFGQIRVSNITDELNVTTVNRNVTAHKITGNISIATSHADIIIDSMTADQGPAYLRNENGNLIVSDFSGAFDIKNEFGKINLDRIQLRRERSRIRASFSPIDLDIIALEEAGLAIKNNNEDIRLVLPPDASADFSLEVTPGGEIHATGLNMRTTLVEPNRLDFISGDGVSRIRATIAGHGDIDIKTSDGENR